MDLEKKHASYVSMAAGSCRQRRRVKMNSANLIGRLTRDPEVRYTNDSLAVARFTLAVNRPKKGEVDYINCIAFGKTAEIIEKYE